MGNLVGAPPNVWGFTVLIKRTAESPASKVGLIAIVAAAAGEPAAWLRAWQMADTIVREEGAVSWSDMRLAADPLTD